MAEEGGPPKLVWVIIVPLCMALGAFGARLLLKPAPAAKVAPVATAAPAATPAAPAAEGESAEAAARPADEKPFDLPGDDTESGEAGVTWAGKPGDRPGQETGGAHGNALSAGQEGAAGAGSEADAKTGFVYGVLTKAAGKVLKNPKAVAALFNNEYVVKGFMSRDTVKKATASKASLAAYLGDPANLSKFMAKPEVQQGMRNSELVNTFASTKMVAAMLDTPGGKALASDPQAMAAVVKANPDLGLLLANPAIMSAMMKNPRTANIATQAMMRK